VPGRAGRWPRGRGESESTPADRQNAARCPAFAKDATAGGRGAATPMAGSVWSGLFWAKRGSPARLCSPLLGFARLLGGGRGCVLAPVILGYGQGRGFQSPFFAFFRLSVGRFFGAEKRNRMSGAELGIRNMAKSGAEGCWRTALARVGSHLLALRWRIVCSAGGARKEVRREGATNCTRGRARSPNPKFEGKGRKSWSDGGTGSHWLGLARICSLLLAWRWESFLGIAGKAPAGKGKDRQKRYGER
jgi:hypothetical protein